jgi:hypothetical protein
LTSDQQTDGIYITFAKQEIKEKISDDILSQFTDTAILPLSYSLKISAFRLLSTNQIALGSFIIVYIVTIIIGLKKYQH